MKKIAIYSMFFILIVRPACAQESSGLKVIGETHTIATINSLSGPGSTVPNLANTYDMSIFEFNLGGKQSLFNGSGITTNSNYPLTDGEAVTNNTHIGLSSKVNEDLKAEFLAEIYGLIGDRAVGRAFGVELPWDDFPRENGYAHAPHFNANLYQGSLEGTRENFEFKLIGGTLTSKSYPEFSRKEINQVRLGSLVYRTPIANGSFFEKEERKLVEGRHPLLGFDFLGNLEYMEAKYFSIELFSGTAEPTPISEIERDAYGGRVGVDIGNGNVGITTVYNTGLRPTTGIKENQLVWSVDSSCKILDWLIPFFTFAETDYERSVINESHAGSAYVAGLVIKSPKGHELKGQYQRIEENYDLMAYHKIEHYPSNFQGLNFQLTAPLTDKIKLKGTVYYLEQMDVATTTVDTLFGDSFYSSVSDSEKGTIGAERLSLDWKATKELSLNGYVEHAKFRKNAGPIESAVDKDVYNFYGGAALNITNELYVEGGFRHFFSVGNWQTMNFRSYQQIPEAAIGYKMGKDKRALLIYQYYDFQDHNAVSSGKNDYYGHQVIFEVKWPL